MNNIKRDHIIIFIASYWIVALYICRMHMDGVSYSAVGFFSPPFAAMLKYQLSLFLCYGFSWASGIFYLFIYFHFGVAFYFISSRFFSKLFSLVACCVCFCVYDAFCLSCIDCDWLFASGELSNKKMQRKKICRNYA